jgi:hypothetical protein
MRADARRRMVLSCRETGRPSHDATEPRTLEARDGMADGTPSLEYPTRASAEHCRPPCRLMVWFTPGPPIAPHQKVVAYLALRDDAARIFSERERFLLLSIGGTDAPSRRQRWALRELSRMAARLDMNSGAELDS